LPHITFCPHTHLTLLDDQHLRLAQPMPWARSHCHQQPTVLGNIQVAVDTPRPKHPDEAGQVQPLLLLLFAFGHGS
jgi:hypothetical protein